jgi:hypothetical protein
MTTSIGASEAQFKFCRGGLDSLIRVMHAVRHTDTLDR